MRFFYAVLRVISITGSVVYPTYASYKTLSKRPTQEADLERWLMYWSVMGVVLGIEMVAEWLIRWIPLYYYLKTIFLMYLALPQTQGATPLYNHRLLPLLEHYEPQIDASMARLRSRAYDFVRAKLQELWARIINAPPPSPNAPAPTMQDNPVAFATGFLKTWSPEDGEGSRAPRRSEGASREERREAKPKPKVQLDELDSEIEEDEDLVSPDGDVAPSKASSAYEKLKAD
ncbi:TB2/DP1, HVA22 family [Rhizoctonia solani]|uniref:Protein YOP1 n=1 Tax=Rhizoctonia solani TaxID=456999 RepID=A0A8H7I6B3_9AGAM|nr:TB2/DP1, HVA22 family [Rhizoctonia solani]